MSCEWWGCVVYTREKAWVYYIEYQAMPSLLDLTHGGCRLQNREIQAVPEADSSLRAQFYQGAEYRLLQERNPLRNR
jgi:hypothetical protein